jgi:hypothetical protein
MTNGVLVRKKLSRGDFGPVKRAAFPLFAAHLAGVTVLRVVRAGLQTLSAAMGVAGERRTPGGLAGFITHAVLSIESDL